MQRGKEGSPTPAPTEIKPQSIVSVDAVIRIIATSNILEAHKEAFVRRISALTSPDSVLTPEILSRLETSLGIAEDVDPEDTPSERAERITEELDSLISKIGDLQSDLGLDEKTNPGEVIETATELIMALQKTEEGLGITDEDIKELSLGRRLNLILEKNEKKVMKDQPDINLVVEGVIMGISDLPISQLTPEERARIKHELDRRGISFTFFPKENK